MGFLLFDKNGTFNPTTYGLSPGDTIYVTVVGGGGGGGALAQYNSDKPWYVAGGNGGASSFGNILTASGGKGGATSSVHISLYETMRAGAGTFKGVPITGPVSSSNGYWQFGANGAGGFLPERPNLGGDAVPPIVLGYFSSGTAAGRYHLSAHNSLSSPQGISVQISSGVTNALDISVSNASDLWMPVCQNLLIMFVALHQLRAGNGVGNNSNLTVPFGAQTAPYNGIGGIGYGAGGGAAFAGTYNLYSVASGNSGEIKSTAHVLTNINAITVTVGGGGAGGAAGYLTGEAGPAGSAGSYGASVSSTNNNRQSLNSGRGGYAGVFGAALDAKANQFNIYGVAGGGGGAGGCVAIWW